MSATVESLRSNPVFKQASSEALEALAAAAELLEHPQGHRLCSAEAEAEFVSVLVEGSARAFLASESHEVTLRHLVAPVILGDIEVLSNRPFTANVDTLSPVTEVRIPREALLTFLDADPTTRLELLSDVSRRFCVAARNQSAILFEVPARVASLLLAYAATFGRENKLGIQIRFPLTHNAIAAELGVSHRSVQRTLSEFRSKKILEIHKGWLVVQDSAALNDASGGLHCNITYSTTLDLAQELEAADSGQAGPLEA